MRDTIPLHIWLVGERQVGKSSFIKQVLGKSYRDNQIKHIHECIVDGFHVSAHIYDLPNDSIDMPVFTKLGSCVFVFDITRPATFSSVDGWRRSFWSQTKIVENAYNDIHIIANKTDLASETINEDELLNGLGDEVRLFQTNSRCKDEIEMAFESILRDALDKHMSMMFVDFENY